MSTSNIKTLVAVIAVCLLYILGNTAITSYQLHQTAPPTTEQVK